jgi:hypothetical protein
MPQKAKSAKRERQYAHIKESLLEQGRPEPLAQEIAARMVNKERAQHGESVEASVSSLNDIAERHVGRQTRRFAIAQRAGRLNAASASQCSAPARFEGPLDHEQGAA